MYRIPRDYRALEALQEECDHVRIQISLLSDAQQPDPDKMAQLKSHLANLEQRIRDQQRTANHRSAEGEALA